VKAGHLSTEKERTEVKRHSTGLYTDIGAKSREEVLAVGIKPGVQATLVSPPTPLNDDSMPEKIEWKLPGDWGA
jgi:putative aminopeptidase FrvX